MLSMQHMTKEYTDSQKEELYHYCFKWEGSGIKKKNELLLSTEDNLSSTIIVANFIWLHVHFSGCMPQSSKNHCNMASFSCFSCMEANKNKWMQIYACLWSVPAALWSHQRCQQESSFPCKANSHQTFLTNLITGAIIAVKTMNGWKMWQNSVKNVHKWLNKTSFFKNKKNK